MAQEYSRSLLRVCIAQLCQNLGWNSIHATPLELLTDVLERYLTQLGKVTHRYAEQFGRTDPRLEDVFLSFGHLGVHLNELEDYLRQVDPLPFARDVVAFPAAKPNNLQIPNPESAEIQNRDEHIPDHLPLMYPSQEEEVEEPSTKLPGSPLLEPSQDGTLVNGTEPGPSGGEKRSLTSPAETAIPAKRQRITTSTLPEEALHSQYEMKSVIMTNNGILSPVKQGKLPDSNTPPQIALMKPKTVVTLDFSKDSGDTQKIVEVKTIKTEVGAQDNEKDENQEKRDKKAEIARVLKVIKDVQVVKRGPGRPKSPARSKVPKVIHSKGGVDFSSVTSIAKGADILLKEKIVVLPSRVQDEPLDMSRKGGVETMGSPPPPVSLDDISKWRPEMTFEQRLQFLNYVQKFYMEKQKEEQQEKDIDDTIQSVIQKSVRQVDDKRSEFERLQAELSGESPLKNLYRAPHTQLMDSWRVSHISETYSPSTDFLNREKSGRDSPDMSDGYPSFYSSPWRRGRPPKKPRGRPRGSGLFRGSSLGRESSPVKYPSPYRRVGRPPLYLKGLSPRGRPRGSGRSPGRSPGRPRLSGGSPGRPRGSGGSPRGHSPGRPRLSDYSPGHSPRPGRPRGRPRGRSPRSRSPRGGSPRAILNINFDENPASPNESDTEANENQTSFETKTSPGYPPPYEEMEPESPVQENVSESPPRVTPPPERVPSPKVLTETISETPIPAEIVTIPIKQEVMEESRETIPYTDRQESTSRQSSESRQSSVSRQDSKQDLKDACVSLKKVEEEHREKYVETRRRSSDDGRIKEESRERDEENRERSEERKDKHGEERKERHKEHSHSKDRERSKEHKKKKKKKDKEKDREKKEKHKSREDREEPSIPPLQKLTIKIGGSSSTSGSFSIKQEPKVHSPAPVESPKHRPEIPKLVFKVLPPKPGSTPEHGKSGDGESKPDPTKQSWSSTPVQSEAEKPPTPKPAPKPDPKPHVKSEPIFTPIDETVKHKPSPTRLTSYQPLSPKFKPIPPAEPSKPAESVNEQSSVAVKDGIHEQSEETGTDLDNEESHVADEEVTVSVVGGRVVGGKSGGRGRKRKGSTRRTKPPKFASRPAGSATYTPMGDDIYTPMRPKEEKGASLDEDDRPPLLLREPEPSPPTLFPVTNVPSPITIPALKAAPPPPSPPLTKKSPPKQKHLKEATPLSPLTREPHTKPKPPPVSLPKAGKIKSPRRSSPRKSPKQISPPVRKKFKASAVSPKKISPTKLLTPEDREFHPPRTPSPSRISSPSPSPNSPMYSPPLSPAHNSPLHFMIPPTPAFPTRTTSPPPSPPKPLPDLSPDEEDSSSTMPGGLPSMPPPSLPPMPPTSSAKKAMQRTVVAETVGTFVSASGEKIWICPACTMQDDGSPMIGCDICDDWYHWPCVGIVEEPDEDEQWYCPKCQPSKKHGKKPAKRGRKKKKP